MVANKKTSTSKQLGYIFILLSCCAAMLVFALMANAKVKPAFPKLVIKKQIQAWIEEPPEHVVGQSVARVNHWQYLDHMYQKNQYQLIWFDHMELRPYAINFLNMMFETVADDKYFYRYSVLPLFDLLQSKKVNAQYISKIDILMTDAFLSYAQDALNNDFIPDLKAHDHKKAPAIKVNYSDYHRLTLDEVVGWFVHHIQHDLLAMAVQGLQPNHKGYIQLRQVLQNYINASLGQSWQPMPPGIAVKVGQRHEDISLLRAHLDFHSAVGRYQPDLARHEVLLLTQQLWEDYFSHTHIAAHSHLLDSHLSKRLRQWQLLNGITASGQLDQATREALRVPPQRLIRLLSLNLKRWRRLPEQLGDRHIIVNMAAYQLQLIEQNQPTLAMRVIVGRPNRRTPTLTDPITSVVLNPPWTVPSRIALLDILPKVQKDISYLERNNFQVLKGWGVNERELDPYDINWPSIRSGNMPFYFRQKAGINSALGLVKFSLPNDMAIYLHDTNHRELFVKDVRALSSGCVRLEKPIILAKILLQGKNGWSDARIDQVLQGGKTTHVKLPRPVPVYLIYWTAWVDQNGRLQRRDDVYSWDRLDEIGEDMVLNLH